MNEKLLQQLNQTTVAASNVSTTSKINRQTIKNFRRRDMLKDIDTSLSLNKHVKTMEPEFQ